MEFSQDLFVDIFENIPIAMMVLDQKGQVLHINRRQEEQSKISRDDAVGKSFHEAWSVLFKQQNFDELYWNLLKNKKPYHLVFHQIKPQFFDLKVSGVAYGIPMSTENRFLLIHDISENIRTNQNTLNQLNIQLSETSNFLRDILDSSPDAVLTIDKQGAIQTVNETAARLFGKPKGELLWHPFSALLTEPFTESDIDRLSKSKSAITLQCHKSDGKFFPGQVSITRIHSNSKTSVNFLVILKDLTYELAIESALAERLKLESILSEMFATFINAQTHQIDEKIDFALSRIGGQLGIDRCHLTQYDNGTGKFIVTHSWANEDIEPAPVGIDQSSFPWLSSRLMKRNVVQVDRLEEMPEEAKVDLEYGRKFGTKSLLYLPMLHEQKPIGALGMEQVRFERYWDHELILRIKIISEVLLNVIQKRQSEEKLQDAFEQIKGLNDRLEADRNYLLEEIKLEHNFEEIIGQSESLQKTLKNIEEVAPTEATVLVMGETGTGKELLARAIHSKSQRRDRPLIKVNCASLPVNLIESELFGHEKGAFTGAHTQRKGRFEMADGATLFLDEIGELPLETQAKLLRVLQENEFERLGSSKTISVDIRIIAATNRNLTEETEAGRFRRDLLYRLNVFPIIAPPLRDRKGDLPLLVNWMIKKFAKQTGKQIKGLSLDSINALESYHWPGNVRELQNIVERAVIKSRDEILEIEDILDKPVELTEKVRNVNTWAEAESTYFRGILEHAEWKINGKNGAAAMSGLPPSTFRSKMQKLGIVRPR